MTPDEGFVDPVRDSTERSVRITMAERRGRTTVEIYKVLDWCRAVAERPDT